MSQDDSDRQLASLGVTIVEAGKLALIDARQAGIAVDFQLDSDGAVLIDRLQIQQVIFNLTRNSIEALAEAPTRELHISTSLSHEHITVSISPTADPAFPRRSRLGCFNPS